MILVIQASTFILILIWPADGFPQKTRTGSGNTWSRLLIDYATGVYSGSLYNDTKLYEALPGEAAGCIPNVSKDFH